MWPRAPRPICCVTPGHRDTGTPGHRDTGTPGHRDTGTPGHRDTGTPTGIGLVNGRFSIPLPDDCTIKFGSNAQVWAEVLVGSTANAVASLGRAKLGAVPYAVEANHAVSADRAAATPIVTGWSKVSQPILRLSDGAAGIAVGGQITTEVSRRVGDSIEVLAETTITETSTSSASFVWELPAGLVVDASKLPFDYATVGSVEIAGPGIGYIVGAVNAFSQNGGGGVAVDITTASATSLSPTFPATLPIRTAITLHYTVPILTWTATN
jgi:hypothetical protein